MSKSLSAFTDAVVLLKPTLGELFDVSRATLRFFLEMFTGMLLTSLYTETLAFYNDALIF